MPSPKQAVSCRYHYDPLDRLTGTDQTGEAHAQRFYRKTQLVTEIQGELQRTVFQYDDQLLAQHQKQGTDAAATLLATDQQRSVLHTLDGPDHKQVRYSAYGHRPAESGLNALLGFNGERRDPVTGCYMLGNGYRAFNPVLMRFNSPDSLSPFGEGGLNGYAYCQGDPVNFDDPTGHVGLPFLRGVTRFGNPKIYRRHSLKTIIRASKPKPLATKQSTPSEIGDLSGSPLGRVVNGSKQVAVVAPMHKDLLVSVELNRKKYNALLLEHSKIILDPRVRLQNNLGHLDVRPYDALTAYKRSELDLAKAMGDAKKIAASSDMVRLAEARRAEYISGESWIA